VEAGEQTQALTPRGGIEAVVDGGQLLQAASAVGCGRRPFRKLQMLWLASVPNWCPTGLKADLLSDLTRRTKARVVVSLTHPCGLE
jgi:hypothetical protein